MKEGITRTISGHIQLPDSAKRKKSDIDAAGTILLRVLRLQCLVSNEEKGSGRTKSTKQPAALVWKIIPSLVVMGVVIDQLSPSCQLRQSLSHTNEMTLRIGCNAVLIMQVLKTIPKEMGFAYNGHELTVEDTRIALSRDA